MKAKPNTDQFKPAKDLSLFLEGGAADAAARSKPAAAKKAASQEPDPPAKVQREQKIFRLPVDLINALRRESYEQSIKTGGRVTETELVEQALRAFFEKDV